MRILVLYFLSSILLSCANIPKASVDSSFEKVTKLSVGTSQKKDVLSLLGKPSEVISSQDELLWRFDTPDGGQLISITFPINADIVQSILWVTPPETNMRIDDLSRKYKQIALKKVLFRQENPHSTNISSNLVDEKMGLSVLYQKNKNRIEAIAWFDPTTRSPSTQRPEDTIKYKIDRYSK